MKLKVLLTTNHPTSTYKFLLKIFQIKQIETLLDKSHYTSYVIWSAAIFIKYGSA